MNKKDRKEFQLLIKEKILELLAIKSVSEKDIFKKLEKLFSLTRDDLKDNSPNSKYSQAKSLIGCVLSLMIRDESLTKDENRVISLAKEIEEIEKKYKLEEFIINLLDDKTLSKKNIFKSCEEKFNYKNVRNTAGDVVSLLVKNDKIENKGNGLFGKIDDVKKYDNPTELKKAFIEKLNELGGEFFEAYAVKILLKVIEKQIGSNKCKGIVTGGVHDNGIDGKIEYTDLLGFASVLLIQARTRNKSKINLKEVREFFGAVISEKGDRGVYITTSTFHIEAKKFFAKNKNIVGIDQDKIFDWARDFKEGIDDNEITLNI